MAFSARMRYFRWLPLLGAALVVLSWGPLWAADINVPGQGEKDKNQREETKETKPRPSVSILGKEVMTSKQIIRRKAKTTLPPSLQTEAAQTALKSRRKIQFYRHNPRRGPENAPITVVEMTDLNCLQCIPKLQELDTILAEFDGKVQHINVHLPVDLYNSTNPAAFYGKLAQQEGVFWAYREALFNIEEMSENIFFDKLISTGLDPKQMRKEIRKNARRFYKEIDADSLLAKNMGETKPPAFFINGVRLGDGLNMDKLTDFIRYELGGPAKTKE